MSHLTHPNTVKVLLYGELDDGSLYIVMEYLEGKNLNQAVRNEGPLPPERALPILIQVCGALEEAHRAGIVHRDLKPENIFLCHQRRAARLSPRCSTSASPRSPSARCARARSSSRRRAWSSARRSSCRPSKPGQARSTPRATSTRSRSFSTRC